MRQIDARDAEDEQVQPRRHAGPVMIIEALAQDFLAPEMILLQPRHLRPRFEINGVRHLGEILEDEVLRRLRRRHGKAAQPRLGLFPLLVKTGREEPELRMFRREARTAFRDPALAQNDNLRALAQRADDAFPFLERREGGGRGWFRVGRGFDVRRGGSNRRLLRPLRDRFVSAWPNFSGNRSRRKRP